MQLTSMQTLPLIPTWSSQQENTDQNIKFQFPFANLPTKKSKERGLMLFFSSYMLTVIFWQTVHQECFSSLMVMCVNLICYVGSRWVYHPVTISVQTFLCINSKMQSLHRLSLLQCPSQFQVITITYYSLLYIVFCFKATASVAYILYTYGVLFACSISILSKV